MRGVGRLEAHSQPATDTMIAAAFGVWWACVHDVYSRSRARRTQGLEADLRRSRVQPAAHPAPAHVDLHSRRRRRH